MKIVAVCGCGMGSSVVLKMNAMKALEALGVKAVVEVSDLMTAKAAVATADLVLVGKELANVLGELTAPVIVLDNFVNRKEVQDKLGQYFKEQGAV